MPYPLSAHPALRPVLAAARDHSSLWDSAERFAQLGTWGWDPRTDEVVWSENLFRLVGCEPGEIEPSADTLLERMHPDDVMSMRARLEAVREGHGTGEPMRFRVLLPGGGVRHIEAMRTPDEEAGLGEPGRLVGFMRDVSEELRAQRAVAIGAAVAGALAAWESTPAGARRLLRELAAALDASAAVLWAPRGAQLEAVARCSGDPAWEEAFGRSRHARGVGLAGRAWQSGEPLLAEASGAEDVATLHAAVALPAVDGERVLAVVVLYASAPLELDARLAGALASAGAQLGAFFARRPAALAPLPLTARELDVLRLAADGLQGQQIQERLSVSRSTVKSHLEHIYEKLGVSSRVAAVARALRQGLID